MKLAGALLVMGILAVLTGANDVSTALWDVGEQTSAAAWDTGRELQFLFRYHHVLYIIINCYMCVRQLTS